jgi:saccharopine dehydrogenase (NADP+, L-glutamate forming)
MKKVLVLGAGLVARPLIDYLLKQPDFHVQIASRTVSKAKKLVGSHERGEAIAFDITVEPEKLKDLIPACDLAVSLLPYIYHVDVANQCLRFKKHMVTTSYVSDAMRAHDNEAKKAGVIILNEIGVDPGIDHMSAMNIIDSVKAKGGKILGFYSYCGGLPAPEANTNPLGYKFSWSPRGVVLAGRNDGRYLKDGKEVYVPPADLFTHTWKVKVEGLGELEAYPNRNSMPYIETYGLRGISTMYRGTLRNPGWCPLWKKMVDMGLLGDKEMELEGMTYADFTRTLVKAKPGEDVVKAVAKYIGVKENSQIIHQLQWLSMMGDEPIPVKKSAPLDILTGKLMEKMMYEEGERDMIVLHHDFLAQRADGKKEKITSTMVEFGIPNGDSAMARTVSLPAAIAVRYILEGKIKDTGVKIPTQSAIYKPVLEELEKLGIACKEKTSPAKG